MSKHTPGPWGTQRNAWDCVSVYAPNGQTIARLESWESHGEEHVDERASFDARLIAAAPDGLAAADEALACLMDHTRGQADAIRLLTAFLLKARGGK